MTYKELCDYFGEEKMTCGSKQKKQLARFNKTHEVVKVGRNNYEVVRKKSNEEIQLASDKEQYSKYLQTLLLNLIANNPEVTMTFTYSQIRRELLMVNEHYFPTKRHREEIDIKLPYQYDSYLASYMEQEWFDIADKQDATTVRYNLKVLKKKNLMTTLTEGYVFYDTCISNSGGIVYSKPILATEEEKAEIHQRQLDYIKKHINERRIAELEKEIDEGDIDKQSTLFGKCIHELNKLGSYAITNFYKVVDKYAKELGHSAYAKSFTITRPTDLKSVADYFAPRFNQLQVERYLKSKSFKTIPPFIHEQLTKQLIER